jgi:hypothetical protein
MPQGTIVWCGARGNRSDRPSILPLSFETEGNPMRIHLKDRASEALSTLAIIVFMGLFAAAVLYEGASFMAQSTTSSAPSLPHYLE